MNLPNSRVKIRKLGRRIYQGWEIRHFTPQFCIVSSKNDAKEICAVFCIRLANTEKIKCANKTLNGHPCMIPLLCTTRGPKKGPSLKHLYCPLKKPLMHVARWPGRPRSRAKEMQNDGINRSKHLNRSTKSSMRGSPSFNSFSNSSDHL